MTPSELTDLDLKAFLLHEIARITLPRLAADFDSALSQRGRGLMESPALGLLDQYDGGPNGNQPDNQLDWLAPSYEDVIGSPSNTILPPIEPGTLTQPSPVNLDDEGGMAVPQGPDQLPNLNDSLACPMTVPHAVFGWTDFSPRSVSVSGVPQTTQDANGNNGQAQEQITTEKLAQLHFQQQASSLQAMQNMTSFNAQAALGAHNFTAPPGFLIPQHMQNMNLDLVNMEAIPPQHPHPPPPLQPGSGTGRLPQPPPKAAANKMKRARLGPIQKRTSKPNLTRRPLPAGLSLAAAASGLPPMPTIAKARVPVGTQGLKVGQSRLVGTKPIQAYSTEQKRRIRAERNRESAEKSRLRRKQYTTDLESNVSSLRVTNSRLKGRAEALMGTLRNMEEQIAAAHARGEAYPNKPANQEAGALRAAIMALERLRGQCPATFADPATRVDIGPAGGKRKNQQKK